jgi:hypothetical protein
MKRGILLVLFLAIGGSAAMADIAGDTVTIEFLVPTMSTLYGLSATGVVTASGVTLDLFSNDDVIVLPNSVQLVGIDNVGSSFTAAPFNGVSVQDLTNPSAFTAFSIDPATTVAGFNIGDVSVSGGLLFINYEGLSTPFNSLAQVDLTAATSTVPEPSTPLVLLFGLGAILVGKLSLGGKGTGQEARPTEP